MNSVGYRIVPINSGIILKTGLVCQASSDLEFALTDHDFSLDELLMYDTQIRLSVVSKVSRWIRLHTNQCKIA